VRRLGQYIDGAWRLEGDGEVADRDPSAPDDVLATFEAATEALVEEAIAGANAAFAGWAATPAHARARVLDGAGARLAGRADALGAELAREQGKTLAEAVGEVRRAAEVFRYYAAEADRPVGELYHSPRAGEVIQVLHQPLGAVAAITPWNFPLFIPAFKLAPALLHGNTVVWKPAVLTPIVATVLIDVLAEAGLPPGVVNLVLAGPGPAAELLICSPGIAAVSFTGSTATGRHLAVLAARAGKPLQAEMGGKNAAVVLADADLDRAAAEVVKGAMAMAGQKCTATSRAIVQEAVYEPFVERLLARVDEVRPGPPLEPATRMGPLASSEQRDRVARYVGAARDDGARVLAGAEPYDDGPLARGYFFPPTVLEARPDQAIWSEEVFGPVLAVHPAGSPDEAFELANRSAYGLSGAVFSSSLALAQRAIDRIDVGMLHINSETTGADTHVPFGGIKDSGGQTRELGRSARDFYTRVKTVYLQP
jgi:acyl-CoA reductase-like NAD-dependent aldehyde dehydrogenase